VLSTPSLGITGSLECSICGATVCPYCTLSTPSLGITYVDALEETDLGSKELSTPSLGITYVRIDELSDRRISNFQLPLSGSQHMLILNLPRRAEGTFNSLSRDHKELLDPVEFARKVLKLSTPSLGITLDQSGEFHARKNG